MYSILLINRSLRIELCGLCIKNLCKSVFESETNKGSEVCTACTLISDIANLFKKNI